MTVDINIAKSVSLRDSNTLYIEDYQYVDFIDQSYFL